MQDPGLKGSLSSKLHRAIFKWLEIGHTVELVFYLNLDRQSSEYRVH